MKFGGGTVLDAGDDRWHGPGGPSFLEYYYMAHHAYDADNDDMAILRIRNVRWIGTEGEQTWPFLPDQDNSNDLESSNGSSSEGCN